jgi:hypothetical protein
MATEMDIDMDLDLGPIEYDAMLEASHSRMLRFDSSSSAILRYFY